jgi:hypothetical protein
MLFVLLVVLALVLFFFIKTKRAIVSIATNTEVCRNSNRRPHRRQRKNKPHCFQVRKRNNHIGENIYFAELEGNGDHDDFHLGEAFEKVGMTMLPYSLPLKYRTPSKRRANVYRKNGVWYDEDHAKAAHVSMCIVSPIVRSLLKTRGHVKGEPISIAVIGDSTTAYCFDRARDVTDKHLSSMVTGQLAMTGHTDVTVDFFSSSGTSFSGWRGFFSQISDVNDAERYWGCKYDCLLLIGGWNASEDEMKFHGGPVNLAIKMCEAWQQSQRVWLNRVTLRLEPKY